MITIFYILGIILGVFLIIVLLFHFIGKKLLSKTVTLPSAKPYHFPSIARADNGRLIIDNKIV